MRRLAAGPMALAAVLAVGLGGAPTDAAAAPAPAGALIDNRAQATYVLPATGQSETLQSNNVGARVAPVPALRLDADQTVNASAGSPLAIPHTLSNTGNVAATYRFDLETLPGSALPLRSLRLVLDVDADGIADADEPVLPLGTPATGLSLSPGAAAALVVVAQAPVEAGGGATPVRVASLRLAATIATPARDAPARAEVVDKVRIGALAALRLQQRVDQPGTVAPGTRVRVDVSVTNTGDVPARAIASTADAHVATELRVDGRVERLLLLSDRLPEGLRYVPGSLATALPGAWRLFRLPGDPPFSYRRNGDDAAAIEVAVALPGGELPPSATASMRFDAVVDGSAPADDEALQNQVQAWYDDGSGPAVSSSNPARLNLSVRPIGLALRADPARLERDPQTGRPTGTALVVLRFTLQNFGAEAAHDLQVLVPLAGGAGSFGRLAAGPMPLAGEYALVGDAAGDVVDAVEGGLRRHRDFDGAAHPGLLAPGATLPPYGRTELALTVRVAVAGHAPRLLQSARLRGALGRPSHTRLADESVDGSEPDANGDGEPGNDTSPTPVLLSLPALSLTKTASTPRVVPDTVRRYEVDYTLRVRNDSASLAPFVQLVDALECAFGTGGPASAIVAWRLVGVPVATRGRLAVHPGFTGRADCGATPAPGADPYASSAHPPAVRLTDGRRHLAPGESEELRYTVQFDIDGTTPVSTRVLHNTALAAAFEAPPDALAVGAAPLRPLAAAVASVTTPVPADPSGVVYNATTRQPVAGAVVALRRTACDNGAPGPITAAELTEPAGLAYRFEADGGVSVTTAEDGLYAFLLNMPPIVDTCEYRLAVTPPPGSGLGWPSKTLPPADGLAPGGAVQAQPGAPTGDAPTTHFLRVRLGPALPDVWHNHIALDTAARPGELVAEKTADRRTLEIGQSVDYRVRVRNIAGTTITGLEVADRLPVGFRYERGSARLDGQPLAEPAVADGRLWFRDGGRVLADRAEAVLSYRATAGLGTPIGPAVNRAVARSGDRRSNEATWTVRVDGGVFADDAYLFGKVFLDCDHNGVQDEGEAGIPAVRLLLEDGTGAVTDALGRYSLYGLRAITHVVKLDTTTLPAGARPLASDARHGGRGDSRFADLKKGEWQKANFPVDGCAVPAVVDEVGQRRHRLEVVPAAEGEAVSRARLDLQPVPPAGAEPLRRRAARGEHGLGGVAPVAVPKPPSAQTGTPTPTPSPAPGGAAFDALSAPRASVTATARVARRDLTALVGAADPSPAFVDLRDGDTLPTSLVDVRVKGALGSELRLSVDGVTVSTQRVGQRVRLAHRGVEAWEYVGVPLAPGARRLRLVAVDGFGNARGDAVVTVQVPGALARLRIDAPRSAVADPGTPVPVVVRLMDAQDLPVTARTPLTLETTRGRWDARDLDPGEPGTQVFIEGGRAEFHLVPTNDPIDAVLRVSSGVLAAEQPLAMLPELRPLIGAGLLEGVIDFRRRGPVALGRGARDAFEQTLRRLSHDGDDDTPSASARLAFYLRGTVRGDLLLTAAYDSDKDTRERLFRDIQPDRFYPIYGDASVRTFDAQSTGRLYLRVDRQKSYLLVGDFTSGAEAGAVSDPLRLSRNARAATGVKLHHEDERLSATAHVSHDSLQQAVIELPADGTSGPYTVPGTGDWAPGSEQVELLVRDRDQPGRVLSTVTLTRLDDYVVDPTTRRLQFTAPVASLDGNLNTRHIRIRYETDTGGPAYWQGGAEVQSRVGERLQLGAAVQRDANPANPGTLAGIGAVASFGAHASLVAEVARSQTALTGTGQAERLAWQHEGEGLQARAQVARADAGFVNPTAGLSPGRTEASAQISARLADGHTLRAEGHFSADADRGARVRAAALTLSSALGDGLQGELGLRTASQSAGSGAPPASAGDPFALRSADEAGPDGAPPVATADGDTLSVRSRLTLRPAAWPSLQTFVEIEQDLRDAAAHRLAFGGDWQLGETTRVYGRYEPISRLAAAVGAGGTARHQAAVLGIENGLLAGGRLFNELRLGDTTNGREALLASGARQSWQIAEGLRLGGSVERTGAFGGRAGREATAATAALDYTADPRLRLHAALEARVADSGRSTLATLGLAYKIDSDWSLLVRSAESRQSDAADDGWRWLSRRQVGLAWRQAAVDRWNGLARYEHRRERSDGGEPAADESTHIASVHLNHQPRPDLLLSARAAARWGEAAHDGLSTRFDAQLLSGRATWDISRLWDACVQAALHRSRGGLAQRLLGVELGHHLRDGLWVSVGWNLRGISDPLLASGEHLDRGLYLRLRFKFDEGLVQ